MNNIVATGIKGLDAVLGGGIPAGTCVLLLTPPLIESKIFYMEYIYRGILANEPGMIVSMDSSPETLKVKAAEYAWDFDAGEKSGLLRWVDGYSLNAKKEAESTNTIRRIGGSIAVSAWDKTRYKTGNIWTVSSAGGAGSPVANWAISPAWAPDAIPGGGATNGVQ